MEIEKEEALLKDDINIYIENTKGLTDELLKLVR